jgi:hypothetical protein
MSYDAGFASCYSLWGLGMWVCSTDDNFFLAHDQRFSYKGYGWCTYACLSASAPYLSCAELKPSQAEVCTCYNTIFCICGGCSEEAVQIQTPW